MKKRSQKPAVKPVSEAKPEATQKARLDLKTRIQVMLQAVLHVSELVEWMHGNHGHADHLFSEDDTQNHCGKRECNEHGLVWDADAVSSLLDPKPTQRVMDLLGIQDTVDDAVAYAQCLLVGLRQIMSTNMISRVHQYDQVKALKRLVRLRMEQVHPAGYLDLLAESTETTTSWLQQQLITVRCNGAVSGWSEMRKSSYVDFVARGLMDTLTCVGSRRWIGYRSMYLRDRKTGSGEYENHKLRISGYGMQELVLNPKLRGKFVDAGYVKVPHALSNKTNRNTARMSAFVVDFDDLICTDSVDSAASESNASLGCLGLQGLRNLLAWLDTNKVGYMVHSTSKHTWKNPRLRVLVPLTKCVEASKYKSLYEALMRLSGCVGFDTKCMSLHRYFVDPKLHATKHPVFFVRAGTCLDTSDLKREVSSHQKNTLARNLELMNVNGSAKAKAKAARDAGSGAASAVPEFPPRLVADAVDNIARALTNAGIEYRMGYSSGKPLLYVQCVNHKEHTKTKATDTYITVNTETSYTGMPVYYCSHASCAKLNKQKALESFLGENIKDYSVLSRVHLLGVVRQFLQGSVPGVFNRDTNSYPRCLVTNPGTKNSVVLTTDNTSAGLVAEAIITNTEYGSLYANTNMLDVVKEYIARKLHRPCSSYPMLCHVDIVGHGVVGDEIRSVISKGSRNTYTRSPGNRHYGARLGSNQDHPIVHVVTGCYGEDIALLAEHFNGMARVITRRTLNSAKIEPAKSDGHAIPPAVLDDFYNRANAMDVPWVHRRALPITILDWTRRRVRIRGAYTDLSMRIYDGRQVRVLEDIDDVFKYRVRGFLEAMHLRGYGIMVVCCHNPQDAARFVKAIGIRSDGITTLNKFKKAIGFVESDGFGNRNWNGSPVSTARLMTTLYRNDKFVNKLSKPEKTKKQKKGK